MRERMKTRPKGTIGITALKRRFYRLLDKVADGEEITITKYDAPVAKLVPIKRKLTSKEHRAGADKI